MDQNIPVKRNTFLLVVVVLFNLIWITLLFLSCQADADNASNPTSTPNAGSSSQQNLESGRLNTIFKQYARIGEDRFPIENPLLYSFRNYLSFYSVPLYKPPST